MKTSADRRIGSSAVSYIQIYYLVKIRISAAVIGGLQAADIGR